VQSLEKTFQLARVDKDLLSKQEYDVQVGYINYSCMYKMTYDEPTTCSVIDVLICAYRHCHLGLVYASERQGSI
jgi:hypothetical protein